MNLLGLFFLMGASSSRYSQDKKAQQELLRDEELPLLAKCKGAAGAAPPQELPSPKIFPFQLSIKITPSFLAFLYLCV